MKARVLVALLLLGSVPAFAAEVRDLNTPRSFPEFRDRDHWSAHARILREHVLVSSGLWPLPDKTPLQARVFDRVEREGYTIEKVHIQTLPGFYLAGNLYRPLGQGNGPFPAVLNPHGHWENGRMADSDTGSIAARCINFARQGIIAFSYDMVGYNDTRQVNHRFASAAANQLWNVSLMGLQTWNSIRALDFLESLPVVDAGRIACTGESGGGTQTFMLGAIDDRLAAQAPVVMVSHTMQGGCLCENAPGLRVQYSNMEIAAVPAPRPQILVAATGDWTRQTMTVEGPAIARIYELFDAKDKFHYAIFDYPHNYNRESREAVYAWFGKWLLEESDPAKLKEQPYQKDSDAELRVFPDKLPDDALNEEQLIASITGYFQQQLNALQPKAADGLDRWKQVIGTLWEHALELQRVHRVEDGPKGLFSGENQQPREFSLPRGGSGGTISGFGLVPHETGSRWVAVVVDPRGKVIVQQAAREQANPENSLTAALLQQGFPVMAADWFLTGGAANEEVSKRRDHLDNFFTTYNRTDLQERVADIRTVIEAVRAEFPGKKVLLAGEGAAGLWAMLAAPLADALIADGTQYDVSKTENLLNRKVFFPGLRRLGGFAGALSLAAPNPVLLHNLHASLNPEWVAQLYAALPDEPRFEAGPEAKTPVALARWAVETLK